MSPEPVHEIQASATQRNATGEAAVGQPETGSVWWAELALGLTCCLTAAAVVLAQTALGPFAVVTVVYGSLLTALYVTVAATFGLVFLRSGIQRAP